MTEKKLSPPQRQALLALLEHPDECAHTLRVGLNTLHALAKRGLVVCINPGALGSFYTPQTALEFRLTERGGELAQKEAP